MLAKICKTVEKQVYSRSMFQEDISKRAAKLPLFVCAHLPTVPSRLSIYACFRFSHSFAPNDVGENC